MDEIKKLVWQGGKPKPAFLTDEAWRQWIIFWEHYRQLGDYEQDGAVAEGILERTNGVVEHGVAKLNSVSAHSSWSTGRYPPIPIVDMCAVITQVSTQLKETQQIILKMQEGYALDMKFMRKAILELLKGRVRDMKDRLQYEKTIQDQISKLKEERGRDLEDRAQYEKTIQDQLAQFQEMIQPLVAGYHAQEQQHQQGQG